MLSLKGLMLFYSNFDWQYGLLKLSSFGLVITLIGCFLPWYTVGGDGGLPSRSGHRSSSGSRFTCDP